MSRILKLASAYRQHLMVPWHPGVAAVQRVIFAVYDKADELKLRANIEEFRLATVSADKEWLLIDLANAFPTWMASNEYREAYFECPSDLAGYPAGEITLFVTSLTTLLRERLANEAGPDTVVALMGVSSLFGVARVSTIVEGVQSAVQGRLLVFFPGEYHPESHSYRLLDARDGWNYLAVPLLASE